MTRRLGRLFSLAWLGLLMLFFNPAWGEESPLISPEMQAIFTRVQLARQVGPVDIPLRDQAVLKLPQGYVFIPTPAASEYLRIMGSVVGESFLGLVVPEQDDADWIVAVEYVASGYIKDDDAKTWNVDELLSSYRRGTEAANGERVERGFPPLEVAGWVEKPFYDETTHRLIWSMEVRHKDAPDSGSESVNFNTFALGRDGYLSLNLVTKLQAINAQKPIATELLAALQFNPGKGYADFNASTDKVAEYGLAALVGGIAAKKLGLLAMASVFFAKFAKFIIAGAAVLGAVCRKLLGRNKAGKV